MVRHHLNNHEQFKNESLANWSETTDMLKQRHGAMQQRWADLDKGWEALTEKMSEVGLSPSLAITPDTILVNVGGSDRYIPRSVLEEMQSSPATWTLGDVFGAGVWDDRLPRDSRNSIVLDESPACVEHLIINNLSRGRGSPEIRPGLGKKYLPSDELRYLPYVAGALGLLSIGMTVTGESTVFEACEIGLLTATISSWCPGEPKGLELLYRASRDGWTSNAFHARCESSSSTITLVRVQAQGSETTDSIVGGFSSVSWGGMVGCSASPGAFLFMLKCGSGSDPGQFQPTKWEVKSGDAIYAVCRASSHGPIFGRDPFDLHVPLNGSQGILQTRCHTYDIPADSPYLALNGRTVVELEVFRVCPKATTPTPTATMTIPSPPARTVGKGLIDCSAIIHAAPVSTEEHEDDIHQFGISVADSLQAERIALYHAEAELVLASAKAAASRDALAAVYGPEVAAGKKDPVVELSVRGPRASAKITTLLSTLQACPDSALAKRFNQTWTEREDAHGRAMIKDCSPAVFSKVLDVLRMRKRTAWAGHDTGQGSTPMVRVAIKDEDREAFLRYVNMYFVGCESFITDHIEFQEHF